MGRTGALAATCATDSSSQSLSFSICNMGVGGGSGSEKNAFSRCNLGQVPSPSVPQFLHVSNGVSKEGLLLCGPPRLSEGVQPLARGR